MAVIGMRVDAPDGIAFVFLGDVGAGTVVNFTDNRWSESTTTLSSNENTMTITFPSGASAGSVFTWDSGAQVIAPVGPTVNGNLSGLAGGGDQVFAYQGDASSPSFLYGFSCATAAGAGFVATGAGSSNNESELPGVLDGTTKYFVEVDSSGFNGCDYSGSRTSLSTFLGYITLLNVPGNYAEAPSSSMFDLTGDVFTTP